MPETSPASEHNPNTAWLRLGLRQVLIADF